MSFENAKAFLEEGFKNPKVAELLQAQDEPESQEDALAAYVEAAGTIGFDFTADELATVIEEMDRERLAKTEENVAEIGELADSELDQVAGGSGHDYCESNHWSEDRACKDTYLDLENCWHNDACDIVYHDYWDYRCKRVHFCSGGYNGA